MEAEVDVAAVAGLIGEPARAAMLLALADGRALPATTLAAEARVAASTASVHLQRLVDGRLLVAERSGRHRYYRLAGPMVAEALESLARLAPATAVRSLRQSTHAEAVRRARTCYDHLAGRLGVAVTDALVAQAVVVAEPRDAQPPDPVLGAGRARGYVLTEPGRARLGALGVELAPGGRRPLTRYCVDWSEQRPHLGGRLGAGLLEAFLRHRWVERGPRRVIWVTDRGRRELDAVFGIDTRAYA